MKLIFLFIPGIVLMRKMRFSFKLALVSFIALLPLLVVVWQTLQRSVDDLQFTRGELKGVVAIEKLSDVIRLVQGHRGQTNLVLLGDADSKPALANTKVDLQQAIEALNATLRQTPGSGAEPRTLSDWIGGEIPPVHPVSEWSDLAPRLERLASEAEGKTADQSNTLHTVLVQDMERFMYGIADRSGLLYDPDKQTYLLMDLSVSRLTAWREQIGAVRRNGAILISQGDMSLDGVAKIEAMLEQLVEQDTDLKYSQAILAKAGFKDPSAEVAHAAVAELVGLSKTLFKHGEPAGDVKVFNALATRAINAVDLHHKTVNKAMVKSLQDREAGLVHHFVVLILASFVTILVVAYLMVSFNISFLRDLAQVLRFMESTASGDMRFKARVAGRDELSDMSRSMETLVVNISTMVTMVRSNAALVAHFGDVLVRGNQSLSDRTIQQAANLEETSASVQAVASTVQDSATVAQQSDQAAQRVREVAEQGAAEMNRAIQSIEAIESSTRRMDEIVSVIDGLAFQTNILALNAAVEAARAGESGRGFAVVASEVRSLAKRSADSAKEIRQLISASSAQVETGVSQIRAAGQNISAIASGVRGVAENLSKISAASADQSESLAEITSAIQQLDEITQRNGAMVEQAVSQSTTLQRQAHQLTDSSTMFKLSQGSADEARILVERAIELRHASPDRESFIRSVTDASSALFDRDMYVFVLDAQGRYLAFAGNPAKVGTRVHDVPGIDGSALMNAIISQADAGACWVEYDITNPSSGKVQSKMSYIIKLEDHYVGCGVYKGVFQAL